MEEMNQLKVFTVEEANRLIPRLTQMIEELRQKRGLVMAMEVEIDALELVTEKGRDAQSHPLKQKVDEYHRAVQGFYALIDEIHQMGCFLKDGELGLVDFYGLYNGRVVYLCWKLGEPEVAYWHEVGRGYACRQPIILEQDGQESSG